MDKKYFKASEIADMLNMSVKTFYNNWKVYVSEGRFGDAEILDIAGRPRFSEEAVENLKKSFRVEN